MTIVASEEVSHSREGMTAFLLTVRIGEGGPFRLFTKSGIPIRAMHFGDRLQIEQIRALFAVGSVIRASISHLDPRSQLQSEYQKTDRAVDPKRIEPVGRIITSVKLPAIHVAHVPGEIMFNAGGKMAARAV